MRKNVILPFTFVNGQSMAGSFNSSAVDVTYLDRVFIVIVTTGTPSGFYKVQASQDGTTWVDMDLDAMTFTGTAKNIGIDMSITGIKKLRLAWTNTSGTGSCTATISAKEV